ncbi:hypothetical protein FKP32DRAFT_1065790 [Trametes sanguinea]|nr:hypothetical protein FKP32DRAFT_1065790 [Trametes sanguinea]
MHLARQLNYYGCIENPVPSTDPPNETTQPPYRLARMLRAMPRLRGITVSNSNMEDGISWYILEAILSTPQLRSFEVKGRLYRSYDQLTQTSLDFAPLESFRYRAVVYCEPRRPVTDEKKLVSNILSKLSATLVTLVLPAEYVPIHTMPRFDWPKLREIHFAPETVVDSPWTTQML